MASDEKADGRLLGWVFAVVIFLLILWGAHRLFQTPREPERAVPIYFNAPHY